MYLLVLLSVLFFTMVDAAEVNYTFQSLDLSVPGHPELKTFPDDINDRGEILANVRINNLSEAMIVSDRLAKKKNVSNLFSATGVPFADTIAYSINAAGQIVGGYVDSPVAPSKAYGFIRDLNGHVTKLDFPGADGTSAFGISDNKKVVGQYYGPLEPNRSGFYRFHCFIYEDGTYRQIDFPRQDTYTNCYGINKRGQVIGEYITFNPLTNETIENGHFIYDNGQFTNPFPLNNSAGWVFLVDINDMGQSILMRSNGGSLKLQLFDEGFFDITGIPQGWILSDIGGMNNDGQFVGAYQIQTGVDFLGRPVYEHHGFVATPAPMKFAGKAKK